MSTRPPAGMSTEPSHRDECAGSTTSTTSVTWPAYQWLGRTVATPSLTSTTVPATATVAVARVSAFGAMQRPVPARSGRETLVTDAAGGRPASGVGVVL